MRRVSSIQLNVLRADGRLFSNMLLGQQTRTIGDAVEHYSQLGLRTLCLAWRELEENEYLEWSVKFKEASSLLVDREVIGTILSFCCSL